jgi:hypothetical protein
VFVLKLYSSEAEDAAKDAINVWIELCSLRGEWVIMPIRFPTFAEARNYHTRLHTEGYFAKEHIRVCWDVKQAA